MQGYLVVSVEKENELQKALLESQEQARELKTKLQATQERLE